MIENLKEAEAKIYSATVDKTTVKIYKKTQEELEVYKGRIISFEPWIAVNILTTEQKVQITVPIPFLGFSGGIYKIVGYFTGEILYINKELENVEFEKETISKIEEQINKTNYIRRGIFGKYNDIPKIF